jgi:CelD/BcsL family acetyltransferase involved in cellulose biosynthesis
VGAEPAITIEILKELDAFAAPPGAGRPAPPTSDLGFFYFHHPAWADVVWRRWEAARGSRPFLLRAWCGDRLAGWWPLVRSKRTVGYRLQNLGQELCDYAFPFVAAPWADRRGEIVRAMLQTVSAHRRQFAFAQFAGFLYPPAPFAAQSTDTLRAWLSTALPRGWRVDGAAENPVLDLRPCAADPTRLAEAGLSPRFYKTLRRDEARLRRLGRLTLDVADDTKSLDALRAPYAAWLRHRRADADGKLDAWWEFFGQVRETLLHASVLSLDGRPVSLIFGFRRADEFDFFSPAFDPEHAPLSPGKIHLWHLLQRLVQDGCVRFNFLVGGEAYKQHWASGGYTSWRVRWHHAGTPHAALHRVRAALAARPAPHPEPTDHVA